MRSLEGLIYDLSNAGHYDRRMMIVPNEDVKDALEYLRQYKEQRRISRKLRNLVTRVVFCTINDDGDMDGTKADEILNDGYYHFADEEKEE